MAASKHIALALFLFFAGATTFAQNNSCSGQVADSISGEPLAYVTVQLLKMSDSTLYAGAITDGQGNFSIQNLMRGDYLCRFTYVGYQKKDVIVNIQEKRVTNLGKIELLPAQIMLPELSVNAQAPVTVKIDRTIYQIDSALLSKVTTSAELLSKMPELHVNKVSETVSIKGKENTTVMLNGVLAPTEVKLHSINPQNIDRIEIITVPASEYGTDVDGIVNIILKEDINAGYSFNIIGQWCAPPWNSVSSGIDFQYGSEKFRYTFSYWCNFENQKSQSDTTYRKITDEDDHLTIYQSHEKPDKRKESTHYINNTLDFYPNKSNYLRLLTSHYINAGNFINKGYATQQYFNDLSDTIFSQHQGKENYFSGNYTLFHRKNFGKDGHKFTTNFNFFHWNSTENYQYKDTNNADLLPLSSYTRKENTEMSRYSYNLKLDYYNPISAKFEFNTGALGYYQTFFNDYRDGGFSDTAYNYSMLKSHYYVDVLFRWQNTFLRIGNKIEGYYAYMENDLWADQWFYLPSLAVSQKINTEHTVRFNYRTVNYYPGVWILNPYRTYSADSLTAQEGNPNIKPVSRHDLSLEYLYNKGMLSLQTNVVYRYMHNEFMYESTLDEQNVLVSRPNNEKGRQRVYLLLNASLDFDFLLLSCQINPYYEYFNNENDHRKNFSYDIYISTEFYLPRDFEIDASFWYAGKRFSSQGYSQYAPMLDLSITKKLFKKQVSLTLAYSFLPDYDITVIEQPDVYQWQRENTNWTGFSVSLKYFFQKGKEYTTEQIEKFMDSGN